MSTIVKLQELLDQSKNVVFFGGAGVSTESGIPDFRGGDGLFNAQYPYPPEQIVSADFFENQTDLFFRFYREKMLYTEAKPNAAHLFLAQLEQAGKLKAVITQNIDGLHQKAGSKNVLEVHGSMYRNYCRVCGRFYAVEHMKQETTPLCSCGGVVKPDVVLYQESLDMKLVQKAREYIQNADMILLAGTSLQVYPAAGLVEFYQGDKLVVINKTTTPQDEKANLVIHREVGKIASQLHI